MGRAPFVLPAFGVEPVIDVDEDELRRLTPYGVVTGFAAIRDCYPLLDIGWEEARECVEAEARWIEHASASEDPAGFDEVLADATEAEAGDDVDWLFRDAEVGAAGLVLALSAAGYATCTCCRGHVGLPHETAPQVGLDTEANRLRLLATYAARAGCGVRTSDGLVWVYGRSVSDLHRLAVAILADSAEFDALGPAPWRQRALEAFEWGEDFEWDESEID